MASKRITTLRPNGDVLTTHHPMYDPLDVEIAGRKQLARMATGAESCTDVENVLTTIWKDGTVEIIHYNLKV